MKYPYTYIDQAVRMLKALVASYIVTGLLLLLTAGLLYRFELSEGKVRIMIIVTYILSCFAGGFLSGKMMKNKKFLWGILVGLLYFGIMLLVSLAVNRQLDRRQLRDDYGAVSPWRYARWDVRVKHEPCDRRQITPHWACTIAALIDGWHRAKPASE